MCNTNQTQQFPQGPETSIPLRRHKITLDNGLFLFLSEDLPSAPRTIIRFKDWKALESFKASLETCISEIKRGYA